MRCIEILLDLSFIDLLLSLYGFGWDTDKMLPKMNSGNNTDQPATKYLIYFEACLELVVSGLGRGQGARGKEGDWRIPNNLPQDAWK